MSIIVVNQFSCILIIIYYLILHRIITLQHRVTKYILHSINSVVVANTIGEHVYMYIYYLRIMYILLNSYWFITVIRRGNVTRAQVKVLKTIFHYVCYRITLLFRCDYCNVFVISIWQIAYNFVCVDS